MVSLREFIMKIEPLYSPSNRLFQLVMGAETMSSLYRMPSVPHM